MRALLDRSRSARFTLALAALGAVLPLVQVASATDEAAFRLASLRLASAGSDLKPTIPPTDAPAADRPARRIPAAARSRPLGGIPARHSREMRLAARGRGPIRFAQSRPAPEPQVVFPKAIVLPKPPRPAIVSIYQDNTLRSGDAVMMADGIHVFHGIGEWPYRPRDFTRLTAVAALDWRLRQTLDELDRSPPVRLSSAG